MSLVLKNKTLCTMCGKPFDKWDMSLGDNRYDIFVNYPSKYDLKRLHFDFCCSCFDKVLDTIIQMCQNNPVEDENWWDHCLHSIDGKAHICRNPIKEADHEFRGQEQNIDTISGGTR